MKLSELPFDAAFPHGLQQLRVLTEPAECPTCRRAIKLAVVHPAQPELDRCLGCVEAPALQLVVPS